MSAKPKSRRAGSRHLAGGGARSGGGGDQVGDRGDRAGDDLGSSVGWLLLSALVGQPGSRQELAEPGLGPAVGEPAKDVAEVLEGRCADEVAVDDEGVQHREPASAVVGAREQEIATADGGPALLTLDMGVGQRDAGILKKRR